MSGRGLLERALLGIAAAAIFVLLFFFLAAALVLAAVMVVVLLTRLWWLKRSLGRSAETGPLTAEYTVIERESVAPELLPDNPRPATQPEVENEDQRKPPAG